jgi:hypothetical protein
MRIALRGAGLKDFKNFEFDWRSPRVSLVLQANSSLTGSSNSPSLAYVVRAVGNGHVDSFQRHSMLICDDIRTPSFPFSFLEDLPD